MNNKIGSLKKAPRSKKEQVRNALREAVDLPAQFLVRLVGKRKAKALSSGHKTPRYRHD
jgi:hypothetical protein